MVITLACRACDRGSIPLGDANFLRDKMKNEDEKSSAGDEGELNFINDNTVYIHGAFDENVSKLLHQIKRIIKRQSEYKHAKIIFDISSNGGYVYVLFELLALIEEAKKLGVIVETRSMSTANSCGAILLMSGTVGHRYGSPLSYVLIHHPIGGFTHSTEKQLERTVAQSQHLNKTMKKLIQKYSNIPAKELEEMLCDDSYYIYGDKLLKYGIIDHITFKI